MNKVKLAQDTELCYVPAGSHNAMHNLYYILFTTFYDDNIDHFMHRHCAEVSEKTQDEIRINIADFLQWLNPGKTPAEAMQELLEKYEFPKEVQPAIDRVLKMTKKVTTWA